MAVDYSVELKISVPEEAELWSVFDYLCRHLRAYLSERPGRLRTDAYDATNDEHDVTIEASSITALRAALKEHGLTADTATRAYWLHGDDDLVAVHLTAWLTNSYGSNLDVEISGGDKLGVLSIQASLTAYIEKQSTARVGWAGIELTAEPLTTTTHHRVVRVPPKPDTTPVAPSTTVTAPKSPAPTPKAPKAVTATTEPKAPKWWRTHLPQLALSIGATVFAGLIVAYLAFAFGWI